MDREPDGEQFDQRTARFLTNWGQRSSRRGILAAVGKFALRLAGLSILPLLPVDRAFAAVGNCSGDWRLCGIFGWFCKDCCNDTASLFACPSCTNVGSSWSACCCSYQSCTTSCYLMSYTDCCGTKSGFTDTQTEACQDPNGECFNNPIPQPVWCGTGTGTYRCTVLTTSTTSC